MNGVAKFVAMAVVVLQCVSGAQAVEIQTVAVGNPGNSGNAPGNGLGGVDHFYNIGEFEVTAGQYAEFLNAVAAEDTYGLYNTNMWTSDYGCKIERSAVHMRIWRARTAPSTRVGTYGNGMKLRSTACIVPYGALSSASVPTPRTRPPAIT